MAHALRASTVAERAVFRAMPADPGTGILRTDPCPFRFGEALEMGARVRRTAAGRRDAIPDFDDGGRDGADAMPEVRKAAGPLLLPPGMMRVEPRADHGVRVVVEDSPHRRGTAERGRGAMSAPERVADGTRVTGWMRPLPAILPAFATAAAARRRLRLEGQEFLVVVAPATGRLLGAVDREALAPRACCHRRGERCTVVQHLAPDVHFCFTDEKAEEVIDEEADLARHGMVPARRRIPLLVVNGQMQPLGIFHGERTGRGAGPAIRSRAA